MGIELELGVLLALVVFGTALFGVFEVETPKWRRVLKWAVVTGGTVALYFAIGHVALVILMGLSAGAVVYHGWWCRCHGIHPIHATPRREYYRLRGWDWRE